MRAFIFAALSTIACASFAAPPECLPSALALSTTPIGHPVARHIDRPSLFMSSNHGLAAYWFCQGNNGQVSYWEIHGTPQAILAAGGASVLEMLYAKDRDASLTKLSETPCSRADIADADERQLCTELLNEVRAQWPQTTTSAMR